MKSLAAPSRSWLCTCAGLLVVAAVGCGGAPTDSVNVEIDGPSGAAGGPVPGNSGASTGPGASSTSGTSSGSGTSSPSGAVGIDACNFAGNWNGASSPGSATISQTGSSLTGVWNDNGRPSFSGNTSDEGGVCTANVTFPDDASYVGTLVDGGCTIDWSNDTSWSNDACSSGSGDAMGELTGLRWELPCLGPHYGGSACAASATPVVTAVTAGGAAGTTYDVALRFRGVIEHRSYEGGTQDGSWYVGGPTPSRSDTTNIYSLRISNPPQQYFLNAGASGTLYCFGVDYTETVQIAAGATVTLTADPVDAVSAFNQDANGSPIVVPGIPPAPDAYDGQFLQMDVVSVTAH